MKVMIAVDGSECSQLAIENMSKALWGKDDTILVLAVVEPVPAEFGIGYVPTAHLSLDDRIYQDCVEVVDKAASVLQKALPDNDVQKKVGRGLVAETICTEAELLDADLIVMGSHGRKGITHFLLGSVAEEVLKKSPCSVKIIKLKKSACDDQAKAKRAANQNVTSKN